MMSLEYVSKLLPSKGLRKLAPNRSNVSIQWKLQTPMPSILESSALSTGTPLIGEAILDTTKDLDVKSFSVTLRLHHHYKKPLRPNCPDCAHHYVQLQRWAFIDRRIMPANGRYPFMFTTRLDNDTPPSVTTPLLDLTHGQGEIYAWEAIGVEWRVKEHVDAPLGICARHAEQDSEPTIRRQSVSHIIAKGRPRNEWRPSWSDQETTSTLSFEYGPIATMIAKRNKSCVCEEASNSVLKISHDLVLEVPLSALTMPSDKADNTAASNSSRKIRIRRPVILTECQDNASDNTFENLGETLPGYTRMESDLPAYAV
ncbi:LDB19 [Fusarium circinatum]|uniref:LDB19 n=1 Tax=Fusarium circinatum TaxID=48490 RepID=A0A8H5X4Z3_FUSCI|nr:LDB19 [Fusarium circinatum]